MMHDADRRSAEKSLPEHWGYPTMVDVVRRRAELQPGDSAFTFLRDGELDQATLSYHDLDRRGREVAAELQRRGAVGERVLVVLEPGLDYIASLIGCFYAGAVAVPVYPPDPFRIARTLPRLQAIFNNADCRFLFGASASLEDFASPLHQICPEGAIAIESISEEGASEWRPPPSNGQCVALLQYTSGATGAPRGVVITHDNLMSNLRAMERLLDVEDAVAVQWLPPYHDMGLIGGIFLPLFAGRRTVLMSPLEFMRRPARWLEAITRYRGTSSAAPNFAFELCLKKVTDADCELLDLSSWQVAATGAEPVRSGTLDRFCDRFEPYGFRREAFVPAYGMAETTLMVSLAPLSVPPMERDYSSKALELSKVQAKSKRKEPTRRLVACGPPSLEIDLEIVDPETCKRTDGVGEIWVRGPGVASGYWRQSEFTSQVFGMELDGCGSGFLRTGDLGFLSEGQLFIVGRLKEMIILGGRNYFPQDIELAIQSAHSAFKRDGGAVTAIDRDNQERIAVFQEVQRPRKQNLKELTALVRQCVIEETLTEPAAIVLIPVGDLPKTSSGKTRRSDCWRAYQAGEITPLDVWTTDASEETPVLAKSPTEGATENWLAECWSEILGRVEIGREDNFFELGGKSLQVVQVLQCVAEKKGLTLPLKALFEHPRLCDLAKQLDATTPCAEQKGPERRIADLSCDTLADRTLPRSLSSSQRRFWMLDHLGIDRGGANVPLAMRLSGAIDPNQLQKALDQLVARHDALRARFEQRGADVSQRLVEDLQVPLEVHTASPGEQPLLEWALDQSFLWRPFDLLSPPLLRGHLIQHGDETALVLVLHHIACDGASIQAIVRDLASLYAGEDPPEIEQGYWDYLAWRESHASESHDAIATDYWRDRLAGAPTAMDLPLEHSGIVSALNEIQTVSTTLSSELGEAVERLASTQRATPFMVYLSTMHLLLSHYTQDDRIGVGVAVAGREYPVCRDMVGCFINTIPNFADVSRDAPFSVLLEQVRERTLADMDHASLPWEAIVDASGASRAVGRMPLVQTFFVYDDQTLDVANLGGAKILDLATDYRGLGVYDLTLVIETRGAAPRVQLIHDPQRIPTPLAQRMIAAYQAGIEAVVANPELPLSQTPIPPRNEQKALQAVECGRVTSDASGNAIALIGRQVSKTPQALAVECGERTLTYKELWDASERIASHLRRRCVGPGDRVGLLLDRSVNLLAAILGVWRAGAAYVPLDGAFPQQRLAMMIEDAELACSLTEGDLYGDESLHNGPTVSLPEMLKPVSSRRNGDTKALFPEPSGNAVAYVMYTSGSTGRPKGVVVPHSAVLNFLQSFARDLRVMPHDRVLASTTISFDISVLELFLPLVTGARVVMADSESAGDPRLMADLMRRREITIVQGTPSTFRMLLSEGWRPEATQRVLSGGEELTSDVARTLFRDAGELWNVYGPTETTIWSTLSRIESEEDRITLGHPIDNTRCYVLNWQGARAPKGAWGELAIAGQGVSLGYWNQPELTAKQFPADPFVAGERMYLTGDAVRRLEDGTLQFRGRGDGQVKVRGHRVELREIELVLTSHEGVGEAVVVLSPDSGDTLVAYFSSSNCIRPTVSDLRETLADRLPDYMIPSAFFPVDQLPRTANGKLDRRNLPKIDSQALVRSAQPLAPRSPVEERIASWWRELLRLEEVGVYDNFFEVGGHSLLAMQMAVRLRDELGADLPLRQIYERATIADWAEMVVAAQLVRDETGQTAALIEKLSEMTDEEAIRLLDSMQHG